METERRITRVRRPRLIALVEEPVEEDPGREMPWIFARRGDDLTFWILHTADCRLSPPRPVLRWPAPGGEPPGSESARGSAGLDLALQTYLELNTEACAVCKPGTLLRENLPIDAELNIVWAERGGR